VTISFVAGLLRQVWDYGRFAVDERAPAVALFGVLFLAVCLVPAVLADLLRLPVLLEQALFGRADRPGSIAQPRSPGRK
jgi:hypothetical protein